MNREALKKQLIVDEGKKCEIYLDSMGLPTFGVGHLLTEKDLEFILWKNRTPGQKIPVSLARIEDVLNADVDVCLKDCKKLFPGFDKFIEELQQILANMMFNLGYVRLSKFKKFIQAVLDKNYKIAALEMANSFWYKQVGNRAKRLVDRMEKLANDSLCNNVGSQSR